MATLHDFIKASGLKTENEFYQKYPTEDLFFKDFPQLKRKFERGGVALQDERDLASGAFINGANPITAGEVNAELEGGEHVQFPDGSVAQVLGERHTEGGVDLVLPNYARVLSDTEDLPIGGDIAKKTRKILDLKKVSAKDTFSDVIDAYAKKIGYYEVIKQQRELFKKAEKYVYDVKDIKTAEVNRQHYAEKLQEVEDKRAFKEQILSQAFDLLFFEQEAKKGTPPEDLQMPANEINEQLSEGMEQSAETVDEQFQRPEDSEFTEEEFMQYGGQLLRIEKLAKESNVPPRAVFDRLISANRIFKVGGQFKKYQEGDQVDDKPNRKTAGDFDEFYKQFIGRDVPPEGYSFKDQTELLKVFANMMGEDISGYDLSTQKGHNDLVGKLQKSFVESSPDVALDYTLSAAPSIKTLKTAIKHGFITEAKLKELGFSVPTKSGNVLGVGKDISKESLNALNKIIRDGYDNLSEEKKKSFLNDTFVDNQWYYRFAQVEDVDFNSEKERDDYFKDKGYTEVGNGVWKTDKTGLYIRPHIPGEKPAEAKAEEPDKTPETEDIDQGEFRRFLEGRKQRFPRGRMFPMPGNFILPPTPMQPERLSQIQGVSIDPLRIGIERNIAAIDNSRNQTNELMKDLPQAQRAALAAATLGTSQASENDAIAKAMMFNAQQQTQADQYNNQNRMRVEQYNEQAKQNYEARMLRSRDNWENDLRDYYATLDKYNHNWWNEQLKMNTLDNMFEDMRIDPLGIAGVYSPEQAYQVARSNPYWYNTMQSGIATGKEQQSALEGFSPQDIADYQAWKKQQEKGQVGGQFVDGVFVATEDDFDSAFKNARQQLGEDGIFQWKGKNYNTRYAEPNTKDVVDGYKFFKINLNGKEQYANLYPTSNGVGIRLGGLNDDLSGFKDVSSERDIEAVKRAVQERYNFDF